MYINNASILQIIIVSIFVTIYFIMENINIVFLSYIKISTTFIVTVIAAYILKYKSFLLLYFCNSILYFLKNMKYGLYSLLFNISYFFAFNIYYLCFNYKKNKSISYKKCLIVKFIINIFVNIIINTYFISLIYGKSFIILLPIRLLKNIILLPIESFIIYSLLNKINYIVNNIQKN